MLAQYDVTFGYRAKKKRWSKKKKKRKHEGRTEILKTCWKLTKGDVLSVNLKNFQDPFCLKQEFTSEEY